MTVKQVDAKLDAVWHDNLIPFQKADIFTITKALERFYDVKIILSPDIRADKTYSGVLRRKSTIDSVLTSLQNSIPIDYKIVGSNIFISPQKRGFFRKTKAITTMKLKTFLIVGCLGGFFALNSCTAPTNEKDYSVFVNPFIGTGGHGHTFPGAVVPHGMIQPSPDTRIDGWDACSGYYYEDSTINGFSHTHVSGTGCCDYGDVLLMPTVGEQRYQTTDPQSQQLAYSSAFSHENETAEPGYYSVFLDTYQVKAEISATKRGAIHRYTFPESSEAGFILDLDYSLQRQTNSDMGIEVISDTEICGHKKTTYWAFDQYINFYAKFSKPFSLYVGDRFHHYG